MALEGHINVSDDSDVDEQSPSPLPAIHTDEFPGDLNVATIPAKWKTEGDDWFVLYNPRVPRVLDISPIYDFNHESVVCCVRFSKVETACFSLLDATVLPRYSTYVLAH